MSNKQMYLVMAALFAIFIGWMAYLNFFVWPKHPEWFQPPVASTQATATTGPVAATMPGMAASTTPSTQQGGGMRAVGDDNAPVKNIGAAVNAPGDVVGLTISPEGAGLDSAILSIYKANDSDNPYTFQTPYAGHEETRSLATRGMTINGQAIDLTGVKWKLDAFDSGSATYSIGIYAGDTHLANLSKTYQISPRAASDPNDTSGGYEVYVDYKLTNLTALPMTADISFNGPTMPPREIERSDDRNVDVGYDNGEQWVKVNRNVLNDFKPGSSDKDLNSDNGNKLLWFADCSVYFGASVRPENPGQIASLHAMALNPEAEAPDRQIVLSVKTATLNADAQATAEVPLRVFIGPKDRSLLEGKYYYPYPMTYQQLLTTYTGFCGLCVSAKLVDLLVDLLNIFHFVLRDWGLSIITLVVLVRLILHPITKSSQVSMSRMQKMGPEMERLKKKHGDDKDALAKAQMQMYKEMGISPFLGCLPMFLQMPIWYALYSALQSEIRLRQAPFLWGFTWIHDLARPDRLITWDKHPFTLPLIGAISALNILPILMGIMMFWQQVTQTPPAATPEAAQQQKMMRWMSLLFSLFLYTAPSGLNLYILTSSTLGMIESKRIRDHIKAKQEADKDKIVVDAKPTRQSKQFKKDEKDREPEKKGFFARLQDRIEDVRKQMEDQQKKKKKD